MAPSPDALSPRAIASPPPVSTPRRISHQEPQDAIRSWSIAVTRLSKSGDNTEIRAISKQPVQEVDVNVESGKDEPGKEAEQEAEVNEQTVVKPMKSSSTLSAVKIRLKKTFSRDSGLDKRCAKKSSGGTSEEELERRKELRRLRQKRIEEELSHEGEYDDDAQSLSTVDCAGESCVKSRRKRQSILPEDSGNFPILRRRSPPSATPSAGDNGSKKSLSTGKIIDDSKLSLSTLRVEDTSEVSLPSSISHSKSRSDAVLTEPNIVLLKPSTSPPRRYSSPGPPPLDIDLHSFDVNQSKRQVSDIHTLPAAPTIEAQRLPSICVPDPNSSSSWRLSYSSHNRGHHLRKLSQQFETPSSAATYLTAVGTQPLVRWLKSHGPRSPVHATTPSETSTSAEPEPVFPPPQRSESGFGGVDGSGSDVPVAHQDTDIHRRLLQSSCSSPELSILTRELSGMSQIRPRRMADTSDSTPLSELIPPTWGNVVADGVSSFYPSMVNSRKPSAECSRLELSHTPANKSHLDETETRNVLTPLLSPTILDTPTTINVSTTSLNAPLSRYSARQIDESSLFASETTSFRERELELSHIQARFASSEARRSPSTPISSKFREEFNLPAPMQPSRSPFQKLVRLASIKRRSEDTDIDDMLLAPPAHRMGFGYRFSTTPLNLTRKAPLDVTPTKSLRASTTTPIEGGRDVIETPVKTRFSALQRIRRLASMGGFDGASDEPEEGIGSSSRQSRESGSIASANLTIARSSVDSGSSTARDPRLRKKSALDNRLGLTSAMTFQSSGEKMQPSRQPSPGNSQRPSHINVSRLSGLAHSSTFVTPVIQEHNNSKLPAHLNISMPNGLLHPSTIFTPGTQEHHEHDKSKQQTHLNLPNGLLHPSTLFMHANQEHDEHDKAKRPKPPHLNISMPNGLLHPSTIFTQEHHEQDAKQSMHLNVSMPNALLHPSTLFMSSDQEHQEHHLSIPHLGLSSPGHEQKEPKAAPAIAPAKPNNQNPAYGQKPAYEPPKWRGPRARNRVPSRDRMDTSQDDSAAVWMKAVRGAVALKARTRKSLQDEDDIFGDWEAQLAGVHSRAKHESRLFGSRGKPKIHQIEQFPPAWCRFPSHEREARGAASAGKAEQVETKDFALFKKDVTGKIEHGHGARRRRPGATMSDNTGTSDELDPIVTADPWHKRLGQRIKFAWIDYHIEAGQKKHAFHNGSLGRRGSMTLDGKVQFPELELLPMRAPPPPSEVVDEEADDLEAEKKRVEEIQKKKVKPHFEALDLSKGKGGVGDLLEIFNEGPEEPKEPQMPVKKKGPMAKKKVVDQYALDDEDDSDTGGGGDEEMPKKKGKKVKDPYALDDEDNDLLGLEEEEKMPLKKKEKVGDPYDIDDELDELSNHGDEADNRKTGELVRKQGHVAEKSLIGNVDPDFHAECLVPQVQAPKKVHVKELSGLQIDDDVIEEEEEDEMELNQRGRSRGRDSSRGRESSKTCEQDKVKTWNGKDWERDMGVWKRRNASVGRDSIGSRSLRSIGGESISSGLGIMHKLNRSTVKSVVKEVRRLEDLEKERKEMMKNGGNLTGGVRSRSVSLRLSERREQLRKSSMALGLEGDEAGEFDLGIGGVAVRGRRMTFGA
ncbi:hypothetical protein CJF31_00003480 [Rutstroemia sp. NJR-2017a BVV2]|nr:hypothetical protein CJF31_00003480 [Rutstroemia sp. NJR-2017a BVV2]